MQRKVFSTLALVTIIAGGLALGADERRTSASPSPASADTAARRAHYGRVQTLAGGVGRSSSRLDLTRISNDRSLSRDEVSRDGSDPLRPYGDESSGAGASARPYERTPVVSPPERPAPAVPASHNYFPGIRSGQSANRNVAHCVPGRHALLHR
jgi:hypothetical protein